MRKQLMVRRRTAKLLVSLAVLIFSGNALAQSAEASKTIESKSPAQRVKSQAASATEVTSLSLQEAIQYAIANNLNTNLASERRKESLGVKMQALAALLPNVTAGVSESNNTVNLAAQGLTPVLFPIPSTFIGPFSTFDARFQFAQSLFNLSSIRNYQSAKAGIELAGLQEKLAREQVASLASLAYLEAVRSQRNVETAQANLDLAKSLQTLENNQKTAGIATKKPAHGPAAPTSKSAFRLVGVRMRMKAPNVPTRKGGPGRK